MRTVNSTSARNNIYSLIDKTNETSEPIIITGKRGNAVLVAEDDWRAIQETLYLLSIPNMRESIIDGMKEPLKKCSDKIVW
ncbi:MAG: type II toxin-antitoxin system Phd/YefM family antitoxin [Melioribacteraceae bacterium]|nr:type II toxin-antitoxin system Phd/YefM family antitoxin [Melioribacteraceae bacterium]